MPFDSAENSLSACHFDFLEVKLTNDDSREKFIRELHTYNLVNFKEVLFGY